jgi:hypothetical protein
VYILFETFFVYVKRRELFEVAELGGTPYIYINPRTFSVMANLTFAGMHLFMLESIL